MGFLDPRERVLDIALTAEGRRQYALGTLRIDAFAVFDDLVDYVPPVSGSGVVTDEYLRDLLEGTPMLEVTAVPLHVGPAEGPLVPRHTICTARPGYTLVPTADLSTGSLDIRVDQVVKEGTVPRYGRFDPTVALLRLSHLGEEDPASPGFSVDVYEEVASGSWRPIDASVDTKGTICFGPFLLAVPDPREDHPVLTPRLEARRGR